MKLTHSCIITADVARRRDFYAQVLQIEPEQYGESYVEFPTAGGTLSIFDVTAHESWRLARQNRARTAPWS